MPNPPKFDITQIRRQLGSRFLKPEFTFDLDPQEQEFVPFYIQLDEMFSDDTNEFFNMTIFGPYRKDKADAAFQSLVMFFRFYGTGRRYHSPSLKDQYYEYLDKSRMWRGRSDYEPMLNIAKRGGEEWISILDEEDSWSKGEMAHFTFSKWSHNPNMKRDGNTFTILQPLYRAAETYKAIPPSFLPRWQNYLLRPIAQRFAFPDYAEFESDRKLWGDSPGR